MRWNRVCLLCNFRLNPSPSWGDVIALWCVAVSARQISDMVAILHFSYLWSWGSLSSSMMTLGLELSGDHLGSPSLASEGVVRESGHLHFRPALFLYCTPMWGSVNAQSFACACQALLCAPVCSRGAHVALCT